MSIRDYLTQGRAKQAKLGKPAPAAEPEEPKKKAAKKAASSSS